MKKRSFFERLSGNTASHEAYDDGFEDDFVPAEPPRRMSVSSGAPSPTAYAHHEDDADGQLPVDVYETANEIVIKAFIAGVRPDEINVSISRDMVVLEGSREVQQEVHDQDYFHQELFWGTFSRTILLPQEVDVDNSSAGAKDGLLTLILPKLDKARQTKLKVKVG